MNFFQTQEAVVDLIKDKMKKKEFFVDGTFSTSELDGFWIGGTVSIPF